LRYVYNLILLDMQPQTTKAEIVNLALAISGTLAFAIIVGVLVTIGNIVK